ncbi:immune inhibitor A [Phytohabitans sp. ZYX-F-186]|uniref:Immune inhibitor A n=1 Tax=Phytohabitans maris TaxID=3071409 RepID=A0ABU0ZH66_9ACTN|nr:immune inhibitor A domain-containing protein [Phytohabitans sp. ZYX-F-186]MDQ7906404.1 immune inhibitor A [Phytohabitans sp. ZYX-F-186]
MARSRALAAAATALLLSLAVLPASAAPSEPGPAPGPADDVRELTRADLTLDGRPLDRPERYRPGARAGAREAAQTPPVGTRRQWLGLDDVAGEVYRKDYTLRGVGRHVEVWVADDLAFPDGDCRARNPGSTEVTGAQVADLIDEFDTTIYPKETAAFSTPPERDGTNARLGPDADGAGGVYTGAGDRTVTLVDNVRDDNFHDFPAHPTYLAGFFSAQLNELFDRNVMTIDAFDWAHRTGANPPDAPTGDLCTSRPARPHLYEGTFAHEWQHLLQYYADPDETVWVNEGLSDFAQTLTGYVDARATVHERGADSHIFCFQGFGTVRTDVNPNPRECGGPENSLNLWEESPNPNATLADYGNAYSFMLFLHDRYGTGFIARLHRDGKRQGLASVAAALKAEGVRDLYRVIHDYQSAVLLDRLASSRGARVYGVPKGRVTTRGLDSTVNLANPAVNATPGAAPNGADYVPLTVEGRDLRSIRFDGARTLPPLPLAWSTVRDDPDRPGDPVLWSGDGNGLDSTAVTRVTVPAGGATLRLLAKYGAEEGYDYGYVTVSTDGGKTYTPVAGDRTVEGPLGPALNGTTDGFEPHTFDLSRYAGRSVLLGFRYVSDAGVDEGGLRIDDVRLGGALVSDGSSLARFDSPTRIRATGVHNWNLRLVGLDGKRKVALQLEFDGRRTVRLDPGRLAALRPFPTVVAIVAYDEPTEQVSQYAPYTLAVNGKRQPGGAARSG